ncbi:hypothetical protein MNBD_GAMMA01-2164 [hydrothermal vent metagenome]|uniref:Transposase n=1 Tax=hydrothermal vent metagenome TaxID=652676 RepID=A0A3B0V9C6_9ZZZZ
MATYSQKFKVQSVNKALNRGANQTIKDVSLKLGVGFSTLQKWMRLAKDNQLEKPSKTMTCLYHRRLIPSNLERGSSSILISTGVFSSK